MCIFGVDKVDMFRLSLILSLTYLLLSCGKAEKTVAKEVTVEGKPCNVKVVVSGMAPDVQFKCFAKAKEKAVSIDRQVDLLDEQKDEFSFSSYTGGKISCELKTKDSYGPDVSFKVFVNGKFWQEQTGKYNPKIEGEIPHNLQ